MSADYFLAFFLLFAASGLFLWLIWSGDLLSAHRDGVDLPRAMARICVARCAPASRAFVLSD